MYFTTILLPQIPIWIVIYICDAHHSELLGKVIKETWLPLSLSSLKQEISESIFIFFIGKIIHV